MNLEIHTLIERVKGTGTGLSSLREKKVNKKPTYLPEKEEKTLPLIFHTVLLQYLSINGTD